MSDTTVHKQTVRNLTVTIDEGLCIGAGTCIAIAPKAFALDENAKAVFLPTVSDTTDDELIDAAKACPVMAILIHDQNGKQIYP